MPEENPILNRWVRLLSRISLRKVRESAPPIVNMPESDPECVGESESPLPLEQIEKQHILGTLETTDGNRTQAAKLLGISIRTLRNKLALYRKDGEFIAGEG